MTSVQLTVAPAGTASTAEARPEIRALTGLRGIAAVWVFLYHLVPMAAQSLPGFRWMERFTVTGDLGVDLFFMLSGFVLSYAYSVRDVFGPRRGPVQRLRYYLQFLTVRLARIYPVHIFVLLALALAAVGSHVLHVNLNQTGTFGVDFFRNVFLVQGWDLSPHLSWDGPAWSVSCEWAAYLSFPFLLLVISRVRRLSSALLGMFGSLFLMLVAFGVLGTGQPQLTYHFPLLRIAGEFIAGCFLYRVYEARRAGQRWDRAGRVLGPAALLAALVGAVALNAGGLASLWVLPLFPLVLAGTWSDDTPWGRLLASPRMVRAGETSYAFYLIHYPALLALQKLWVVPSSPLLRLAVILLGSAGIFAAARLVYDWIEVPARRRIRAASQILLPASDRRINQGQAGGWRPRLRRDGSERQTGVRRDSLLVLFGNVVTGLSNYGFTLVLIWILPARQFSQVASVAALLLVAGTAAQAGIPWVLARELVRRPPGDPRRGQAVGFALAVALGLACLTSVVVFLLSDRYASTGVEVAAIVTVFAVFVAQVGSGYLQGTYRFRFYALLMTIEAVVRLGVGALLAAAGAGAGGAVGGFAVGAVIAAVIALWIVRHEASWPRQISTGLWRQLGGLGGIQIGVALFATLDVIVESVVHGTSKAFAGYQAMLVFTRIPLFISGALSAVVYPHLSKDDPDDRAIVVESAALLLLLSTLVLAVVSDLPRSLLAMVLPQGYSRSSGLLLPLALAGVACGQINYSTTLLQAKSAFRAALRVLSLGLPLSVLVLAMASHSIPDLAWAAAAVDLTIAVTLVVISNRYYLGGIVGRLSIVGGVGIVAVVFVRDLVTPFPIALLVDAPILGLMAWAMRRAVSGSLSSPPSVVLPSSSLTAQVVTMSNGDPPQLFPVGVGNGTHLPGRVVGAETPVSDGDTRVRPLRILHLAFEDHRQPGSGGGSLRTREINSRLARHHEITSVVARYKGARLRVEDGITYRPLGLALGRLGSIVSYHLALPWFVLRHRADLIVEDFAAPHSSNVVPLWTDCPTVAVVQYLFAKEKSRQYHLPLWAFEETGVRMHRHFVAVSQYIADRLQEINGRASIDVVYAGVEPPEETPTTGGDAHLLYIGRLEYEQKGLDLLVDAFAEVKRHWPDIRLRIAGDGPGDERLSHLLAVRGLSQDVDWLGRVDGKAKWDELREATVVLMPSRFETFGLVALEAMAVGTPVAAFDLPSLREIQGSSDGLLLADPEDAVGLGRVVSSLLGDPERRLQMARAARARAVEFDWDRAALEHERVYLAAVAEPCDRSGGARLRQLVGALPRIRGVRTDAPELAPSLLGRAADANGS